MAGECQGRRSGAGRPASTLSLLVGLAESFRSPTARSPRSFDFEGAVGLGIVAAMNVGASDVQAGVAAMARTPRTVAPRRSQPIPIVSSRLEASGSWRKQRRLEEEEEMELSESYTCVISHVGGAAVSKRVYYNDGAGDPWGCCPGVFFDSPPPRPTHLPSAADFLCRCFRCSKDLYGLDIFIYRQSTDLKREALILRPAEGRGEQNSSSHPLSQRATTQQRVHRGPSRAHPARVHNTRSHRRASRFQYPEATSTLPFSRPISQWDKGQQQHY